MNYLENVRSDYIGTLKQHEPYWYWEKYYKDKFVFSIVQNPFKRAVTIWKYRTMLVDAFGDIMGTTAETIKKIKRIPFENWYKDQNYEEMNDVAQLINATMMTHIVAGDGLYENEIDESLSKLHWHFQSPQSHFLKDKDGNLAVNFFKIEEGFSPIELKIKVKINRVLNRQPPYDFRLYYKKKSIELIRELYYEDFINFNYPLDFPSDKHN